MNMSIVVIGLLHRGPSSSAEAAEATPGRPSDRLRGRARRGEARNTTTILILIIVIITNNNVDNDGNHNNIDNDSNNNNRTNTNNYY